MGEGGSREWSRPTIGPARRDRRSRRRWTEGRGRCGPWPRRLADRIQVREGVDGPVDVGESVRALVGVPRDDVGVPLEVVVGRTTLGVAGRPDVADDRPGPDGPEGSEGIEV